MRSPRIKEALLKIREQVQAELAEIDALLGDEQGPTHSNHESAPTKITLAGALRQVLSDYRGKDVLARTLAEAVDARVSGINAVKRLSTVTAHLFDWVEQNKYGLTKRTMGKPGKPSIFHIE